MITRIFYGTAIGLAWALALVLMGAAARAMFELFNVGWGMWP